ncbi:MAG: ATP-dependent DNA helicase RecG [Acidimicrobiia bacterium]|nr:ATP-dependent DNA helicase RecG [Acidimicrobiia bacterium]
MSESARSLAYLSDISVAEVKGLAGKRSEALAEAGVVSVADLLLHAPRRYVDRSRVVPLDEVPLGEEVTVIGEVTAVKMRRVRKNLTIVDATIFDGNSYLFAVWFNQAFRSRQVAEGTEVALSGKVERYRGRLQMSSPDVDVLDKPGESLVTGRVMPVHPTVAGVGPGYLRRAIHNALGRARPIEEPLPPDLAKRLGLVERDKAIAEVHFPDTIEAGEAARGRLVFDELFRLEVALAMRKQRQVDAAEGISHTVDGELVAGFVASLPYELTGAQRRVSEEIATDMAVAHPMHRLLQGEVGSGKTVVAVEALLRAVQGGYQGAIMAPTEVLAGQHFLNVSELLLQAGLQPDVVGDGAELGMDDLFAEGDGPFVTLALLTSNAAEANYRPRGGAKREELLARIADGSVDIVIGTHALIQEGVSFARLGLAVVDEQHRFGVHQRVKLREQSSGPDPDLLIMTATPIPRTLSMTLYGDLDVSVVDEMPPGRAAVTTVHRTKAPGQLEEVYQQIRDEAAVGRQAFVVCPLVEDSDKIYAKSATAEHKRLSAVLADLEVGLIHGQLSSGDKEAVMSQFRDGELDVLVATTVIEVGIDIPNATIMVIEDADRFGLSQLHQLRGRVGRGEHPATCVLVSEPTTPDSEQRIAAMVETTDGFRLAEEDLRIRGQGTVFGSRQAGLADLKLADILEDLDTLITARKEAFALVAEDPMLKKHPLIADEVRALLGEDVEWLFIS